MTVGPHHEAHGRKDTRPFFLTWCIYATALLIAGAFFQQMAPKFDFRNFYAAGYLVRTQPASLYNLARQQQVQSTLISAGDKPLPFVHPSYEALLYAPFSMLSYHWAYLCFLAFNLLLLVVLFLRAYPVFSTPLTFWQPRPGLMLFLYFALFVALWHGQNSVLFLLLCGLAYMELEDGRDLSAGCLLALGLFKFQVALPLAFLCAVRRGRRFTTGFAMTAAGVALLCLAIVGRSGIASFVGLIHAATLEGDQSAQAQSAIAVFPGAMPNLVGLLSPLANRIPASTAFALAALLSTVIFAAGIYLVRKASSEATAFAIATICAALVSYHMYMSDQALILLPMALLSRLLSKGVLAALYLVPPFLVLVMGPQWSYLAVIPTLWMLLEAAQLVLRSRRFEELVAA